MSRTNSWIHDFDTGNVPDNYPGVSFSEIVAAINTHPVASKRLSYGSSGLSINTLRDYQYKRTRALNQSSSPNNIKMSNFRHSSIQAVYVKVQNEVWTSNNSGDDGKIHIRIVGGTQGTYQIAVFTNQSGNVGTALGSTQGDVDARVIPGGGNTSVAVDLDPNNLYKKWSDIVDASDKITITSSTDEVTITQVGGNPKNRPWYKIFIYDSSTNDNNMFMQFDLSIGLYWSGGHWASQYRQLISGLDNEYNSGILNVPNQRTGGYSDELLIVNPGQDGIA